MFRVNRARIFHCPLPTNCPCHEGYEDSTIQENLFTRWFAAGLGVIILSLGEFEVYFHFFSIAIAAIKFF